jgi:hypothetical protein
VIDFRYHLVSIIAVFLALAIGLVIGANLLKPVTETALNHAANTVSQANGKLRQQTKNLNQQVSADQSFAAAASGRLLGHLLTGQSVVLVEAPNADSKVISGVTAAVQQAGGTVTGQLSLQAQFFDGSQSNEEKLNQLAESLAPDAGVTLPAQPGGDLVYGQDDAAQVIAADVVTKDGPGLSATQSKAIIDGFSQSGYLQITAQGNGNAAVLPPATMAIVVAPATPPSSNDSSPANLALIAVAQQLKTASHGAVLAGSLQGSGPGSAIAEVAGAGKVSTVDYADAETGQIMTVQALAELLSGHSPTNYGVGPGAVPSPAPTPSASPTTTAAHQVTKK